MQCSACGVDGQTHLAIGNIGIGQYNSAGINGGLDIFERDEFKGQGA